MSKKLMMCLCVLSNKTICKTVKRKQSYWKVQKKG